MRMEQRRKKVIAATKIYWKHREKRKTYTEAILSFVLWRKIINVYNDIAHKYGNVTVKDFRKYEKLEYKKNKLKLDIDFLNNCKELGV